MGWASGTELMRKTMKAIAPLIEGKDEKVITKTVIGIIEAFENEDWDCQNEMLGSYHWYDHAHFTKDAYDHGYYSAMGDVTARSIPKPKGKTGAKYKEGFDDWLREQD